MARRRVEWSMSVLVGKGSLVELCEDVQGCLSYRSSYMTWVDVGELIRQPPLAFQEF